MNTNNTTPSRKYTVVRWLIGMWFFNMTLLGVLAYLEVKNIPQALGLSLLPISGGIAGYIGVNVWQKKIQNGGNGKGVKNDRQVNS